MTLDEAAIRKRYEDAGQGHVLKYLSDLKDDDDYADNKTALLTQLNAIEVEELGKLYTAATTAAPEAEDVKTITPFSKTVGLSTDPTIQKDARQKGIDAISQGQVAALVLAGGQGTRLGFSGPKGMYDIGLPSGRTLFQLLCERLGRLRVLAKTSKRSASSSSSSSNGDADDTEKLPSLPFYIMTSPINHDETVEYLKTNNYFGLPKEDVHCFPQGMLPCLTIGGGKDNTAEAGKIIMETASKVAMAPDGNGGIYPSLQKTGMLDDMSKRGIQHIHVFSIDNSLTKPADPVFIGYCISQNADCGNKVVWKATAHEKVGVIAEKDGKPCVVEYSEITKEMAERTTTDDGRRLAFGAGNICNHYYTLDFLQNTVLPNFGNMYHVAKKKIPYYDKDKKETVKPDSANNGIKLESFIFDVFPFSKRMAVLDVERAEEFAPVKNAPGSASDSPDTARVYISEQAKRWVTASGGKVVENGDGGDDDSKKAICEIAPLTSYAGEGLESKVKDKEFVCPFSL